MTGTGYHESVDHLRCELAAAAAWHASMAQQAMSELSSREGEDLPPWLREANISSLMASNYAYTLAALLKIAGQVFGDSVAQRLAGEADEIITNGDPQDWNADVAPHQPDVTIAELSS